jgi:hypothetical protein
MIKEVSTSYFVKSISACLCLLAGSLIAAQAFAHPYKQPTPLGYDKYITFMANGIYESVDGSILVDGLFGGDGMGFQKDIMGRRDEEIEEVRQAALDFFAERYGVDPISNTEDFYFTGYQIDPRIDYRAYTVSGEAAPAEGWETFDGGYLVVVTNPEGVTLGGEYEGIHIKAGALLVSGEYKIIRDGGKEPLVFRYRSVQPSTDGLIRCEFENDKYGAGLGGGFNASAVEADGLMHSHVRVVVTFSAHGN